jgi:hypothetical protein
MPPIVGRIDRRNNTMFDHKNFFQAEIENRQREDQFEQKERNVLQNVLREGIEAFRKNKRRKNQHKED